MPSLLLNFQVWDAHKYLLANPCKPTPVITVSTFLNKNGHTPKAASASDTDTNHGGRGSFKITVSVRDAVTRNSIPNVPVTLSLNPSTRAKCHGAATRSTGKRSGVTWICKRAVGGATGDLTVTATSAETAWYDSAVGVVTVRV
jgi:hypothetical protein